MSLYIVIILNLFGLHRAYGQQIQTEVAVKHKRKTNLEKIFPVWEWVKGKKNKFYTDSFILYANSIARFNKK